MEERGRRVEDYAKGPIARLNRKRHSQMKIRQSGHCVLDGCGSRLLLYCFRMQYGWGRNKASPGGGTYKGQETIKKSSGGQCKRKAGSKTKSGKPRKEGVM